MKNNLLRICIGRLVWMWRSFEGQKEGTMNKYTAIIKQSGDWWIGWVQEIPGVNCQERTRAALLKSLKETLEEAIEFNRQDTILSAGDNYLEESIPV